VELTMISVVTHLLTFLTGGLLTELVRTSQKRYRQWQTARRILRQGGSPDAISRYWASRPANWCARPGCPRCWGRRWAQ